MDTLATDVLVIGSGIAGCSAALAAAKKGLQVILVTGGEVAEESNTLYAQGGIIYKGKNESEKVFCADFRRAGAEMCKPDALRLLYNYGPRLVEEILIDELGIDFSRTPSGELDLTLEGAHSIPRIIHADDTTGKAIEVAFIKAIAASDKIRVIPASTAIDLLTISHHSLNPLDVYEPPTCFGAYIYIRKDDRVVVILAKETVLATGGLGRLFLHTTNPPGARGDGYAMARRAGARMINMEYIQFHPTALYHRDAENFLISESLRGEGATLLDRGGNEFMKSYHDLGSLAPRDVVARAIHEEMLKENDECVFLDISHKDSKWVKERFPNIYRHCLAFGIDITKETIPVVPAAHYSCGGVAVDARALTSISRLRAVGEVSCTGIHGANRLASSSLLEGLVWGTLAGEDIASSLDEGNDYFPDIDGWRYETEEVDPALIHQDWLTIKHTMWNYVGLSRTSRRMDRAFQILSELRGEVERFYAHSRLSDDLIGLRNGIQTALLVLDAARVNRRSMGCHFRVD